MQFKAYKNVFFSIDEVVGREIAEGYEKYAIGRFHITSGIPRNISAAVSLYYHIIRLKGEMTSRLERMATRNARAQPLFRVIHSFSVHEATSGSPLSPLLATTTPTTRIIWFCRVK